MSLRFELNLLIHAFKRDVKDEERKVIHEDNIGFYYQKYFRKGLNTTFFGAKTIRALLDLLGDTLRITNNKLFETFLPAEFESFNVFVLLTEEARRDRQRRIDMGEEGAKIAMQNALGQPLAQGATSATQVVGMVKPAGVTPINVRPLVAGASPARPAGFTPMVRPVGVGAPAWRPVGAQPWAAGVARPVSPWGVAGRPMVSGIVRPGMGQPAWR